MKRFGRFMAVSAMSAVLCTGLAVAQDRDDHHDEHHDHPYVKHDEWKKGYKLHHEDWDRGEHIDYRTYHLRNPPRGYEWREIDGNYVMAAVATGAIATVVAASAAH